MDFAVTAATSIAESSLVNCSCKSGIVGCGAGRPMALGKPGATDLLTTSVTASGFTGSQQQQYSISSHSSTIRDTEASSAFLRIASAVGAWALVAMRENGVASVFAGEK